MFNFLVSVSYPNGQTVDEAIVASDSFAAIDIALERHPNAEGAGTDPQGWPFEAVPEALRGDAILREPDGSPLGTRYTLGPDA